jgi:hypothetical protein
MNTLRSNTLDPGQPALRVYTDRKMLAAALRPVYTAVNAEAAQDALLELAESELG